MNVLVVGGSGLLGQEVTRQARLARHQVTATFHSRMPPFAGVDWRRLDIRRRDDVAAVAADSRPELIVNAAYRQADWATTADGAMHVASAAATVQARLVHAQPARTRGADRPARRSRRRCPARRPPRRDHVARADRRTPGLRWDPGTDHHQTPRSA